MARAKKGAAVDLSVPHDLSVGLIERLRCPEGTLKGFLRDKAVPGLRVRVTAGGTKSFVYEAKLNGKAISQTLGNFPLMTIGEAQAQARDLAKLVKNDKQDPRELERQKQATRAADKAAAAARSVTVGELWPMYLLHGKPKRRDDWKPGYRADLDAMAGAGGVKKKRGAGVTRPGPLYPLMSLRLEGVTEDALKIWYDSEAKAGKHQATRAFMMFCGFLRWCSGRPEYRAMVNRDAARAPAILESLPQVTKRTDALQAAQVPGWWTGAAQVDNKAAGVYLRALLLTGARREDIATLKWVNVDFRWRKLTLIDKVDNIRVIPLTPYLAQLLATMPRTNEYVFASSGKTGHIADVRGSHKKVLLSAGIDCLTIHGLRRTFVQRGRAVVPAGTVAQIAGHKPSATAEGYAVLAIDDLRPYAEQIEAHILALAGVQFDPKATLGSLRIIGNA